MFQRIRYDVNAFRFLLSVDITPTYSQITCLQQFSSEDARSGGGGPEIRALNMKR